MQAHLVKYSLAGTSIQVVIWGENPIRDLTLFEQPVAEIEDYIPAGNERIQTGCPLIMNLEVKDTWETDIVH